MITALKCLLHDFIHLHKVNGTVDPAMGDHPYRRPACYGYGRPPFCSPKAAFPLQPT